MYSSINDPHAMWIETKATAAAIGFHAKTGKRPEKDAIVLLMCVALHETRLGDAWNFSHNWGAVQRRAMTPPERAIAKSGGQVTPSDPFEELHGDSSPVSGHYQVWFWKFPEGLPCPLAGGLEGDAAGAWILTRELVDRRPSVGNRLLVAASKTSLYQLAELMYRERYYEGFHDPRPKPGEVVVPGGLTLGQQLNVAEYARALTRCESEVRGGLTLSGWEVENALGPETLPDPNPIPPLPNPVPSAVLSTLEVQQILNAKGYAHPPLAEDGVNGPLTKGVVMRFQESHGLEADGIVGPITSAVLKGL